MITFIFCAWLVVLGSCVACDGIISIRLRGWSDVVGGSFILLLAAIMFFIAHQTWLGQPIIFWGRP